MMQFVGLSGVWADHNSYDHNRKTYCEVPRARFTKEGILAHRLTKRK